MSACVQLLHSESSPLEATKTNTLCTFRDLYFQILTVACLWKYFISCRSDASEIDGSKIWYSAATHVSICLCVLSSLPLFTGVFVVVFYSSISWVWPHISALQSCLFCPHCVFVMSRIWYKVEFDHGLSSKQEPLPTSEQLSANVSAQTICDISSAFSERCNSCPSEPEIGKCVMTPSLSNILHSALFPYQACDTIASLLTVW